MTCSRKFDKLFGVLANGRSLVISCDGAGAIKYSLTNAQGSARELCYRQHQRYWIERAIQEAKSEVGMAQYQVRGWFGWHQHIAMVTLAMLFALQQKLAYRDCVPRLSTHDIVELLSYYLLFQEELRAGNLQTNGPQTYRQAQIDSALLSKTKTRLDLLKV